MTEQQQQIIEHYQQVWDNFKLAGYMSNLDIYQLRELGKVHQELYKELPFPNLHCKVCIIDMLKNLFNLLKIKQDAQA
jgi:hypothetical protein